MDARKIRLAKIARFAKVLGRYRERHGLSLRQLAELLGKPRSTVQHWVSGVRMPPATDLRRLCSRLNINYELMISDNAVRNAFYDSEVLGIEALQHRYLEVKQDDALDALEYLPIAGSLVFSRLVRAGLECRLEANHDFTVWIRFLDPEIKSLTMIIQARCLEGIGYSVIQEDNAVRYAWRPITVANVDSLIDLLIASTHT